MEKYNKILGNFGEEAATKYLEKQHYKILDRNFNTKFGELDIVAVEKDCLCFVEVKTRSTEKYGHPENAVNFMKRNHLINTAKMYIAKKRLNNYKARFDIVEVFIKKDDNSFEVEKINLIKNAFMC